MKQMEELIEKYASIITDSDNRNTFIHDVDVKDYLKEYSLELLSLDADFRTLMKYRDWTTECLWYLGDKSQQDYWNNGWITYRSGKNKEILGQIPPQEGYYQIYHNDIIEEIYWNGSTFQYFDNYISHWKEILKPKNL